jgi:hypothetical protein
MHRQEQAVVGFPQRQQSGAQEGAPFEIERPRRLLPGQTPSLRNGHVRRQPREVDRGQAPEAGRRDDLHRLAVALGERRAQSLVPAHHLAEHRLEGGRRHLAHEAQGLGDVVGHVARRQAVEEPEPLLGEGGGHRIEARRPGGDRHPGRGGGILRRHHLREPLQRGIVEELPQRQLDAKGGPHPGRELGGQQGVPPQVEEVVVDADAVPAQQLRPEPGEHLLHRVPGRRAGLHHLPSRSRQRPAVDLAVGGERQGRQLDEEGRDHGVRQMGGEERPQPGREPRRHAGSGNHIGRENGFPVLLERYDHSVPHLFQAADRRLDLRRLDAEAPDLDLAVGTAGVDHVAIRLVASKVPRAIETGAGGVPWSGGEALGGAGGIVQITQGEVRSADRDLPQLADAGRPPRAPEDEEVDVVDPPAQGDPGPRLLHRFPPHRLRRLRGAVEVDQASSRSRPAQPVHVLAGQDIAARADQPQAGQRLRLARRQEPGHGRGEMGDRDRLAGEPSRQPAGLAHRLRGGHAQLPSHPERGEDVPQQGIVRQAGEQAEAVGLPQAEGPLVPLQEVRQRPVRAHDPLGLAGGARGEGDPGRSVGVDRGRGRAGVHREPGSGHPQAWDAAESGFHLGGDRPRSGDLHPGARPGPAHRAGQAGRGVRRIEDDEHTPGPQHAEQRRGQGHGPVRPHGDRLGGPQPGRQELRGQASARRVEIPPGPGTLGVGRRPAAGVPPGAGEKAVVDRTGPPGGQRPEEVGQDGRALRRRQREVFDATAGVPGDRRPDEPVLPEQLLHARRIEQVGVVDQQQEDLLLGIGRVESEVELRLRLGSRPGLDLERRQAPSLGGKVEHVEEDLEDRRPREVALWLQVHQQGLEGDVLVGEGAQGRLPHLEEEIAEARVPRQIGAQGQVVEEEADQGLGLGAMAAGDR